MNELDRVHRFIVAKLSADVQLAALVGTRIYLGIVPQVETHWPVVLFAPISGADTTANGGVRVLARPLYIVRGVTQGESTSDLATIADRIDAVLQGAKGDAGSDAYIAGIVRDQTYQFTEVVNGQIYRHLGGQYRVHIHATAVA